MSVNAQLTDRERVELTKKAYDELQLGDTIKIDLELFVVMFMLRMGCEPSSFQVRMK